MIDVKNLEKNYLSKDLSKKFVQLERGVEKKYSQKRLLIEIISSKNIICLTKRKLFSFVEEFIH